MKAFRRWMLVSLCAILLLPQALAESQLRAILVGDAIHVSWSGVSRGECSLTIYRDGWPICCCLVHGPDGEYDMPTGGTAGQYKVRLATQSGCIAADAVGESASASPAPAQNVNAPTGDGPGPTPSVAPTAEPTAVPTAAPTAAPVKTAQPASSGATQGGLASQVVAQVNAERSKAGLSELRVDAELTRAAQVRAEEIVRKFSHTRPDGSAWSTVSAAAYGENIAMGQRTADKVMAAWMSSEGHRANILRASYGSIGVCAYVSGGVTYWVQLFGK